MPTGSDTLGQLVTHLVSEGDALYLLVAAPLGVGDLLVLAQVHA
jgi:hypothetical protein